MVTGAVSVKGATTDEVCRMFYLAWDKIFGKNIFLYRISEENDSVYISITKVPHQIKAYRCHCKISLPHRFVISIARGQTSSNLVLLSVFATFNLCYWIFYLSAERKTRVIKL